MRKTKGVYILDPASYALAYAPDVQSEVAGMIDVVAGPISPGLLSRYLGSLREVEVVLSGWGGPTLDETFLRSLPDLKAFFYAGGALGPVLTPAVWEREVVLSSALAANAVPVAEYTLATILFSLKHGWRLISQTKASRQYVDRNSGVPGAYGSTVGLISLGAIGRALVEKLRPFNLNVLAYDPFLTVEGARSIGVERVSLEEVFSRSDVVSLHTPHLPETTGMITGRLLASMKPGATFINTARGQLVREREMIEVLSLRPDLQAVLDVTENEPTEPDSPLYDLPNVVLTPHMAGSVGPECRRMGRYMADELRRYLSGEPLKWRVTADLARHTSHRPSARPRAAITQIA